MESWVEDGVPAASRNLGEYDPARRLPGPQAQTFNVYAIYDSVYITPWLLATLLRLKAAMVKAMYQGIAVQARLLHVQQGRGKRIFRRHLYLVVSKGYPLRQYAAAPGKRWVRFREQGRRLWAEAALELLGCWRW
jgi:hypothetical protein